MTEGDQVLAADEEPTDGLPSQALELAGHRLILRAGDPDPVPLTAPTVIVVVGGLLAAGLAAAGVVTAGRARRERESERDKALAQVQLVGEVAPLVQQSLDLADVLPAVAVQLGDHFGLAGLRLSSGTTSAGQVELFSLGARPIAATPVLVPPERLDAGETLNLALQRGGRSVALLQIVAGRPLDDSDLGSLRAITELITAAVVNATLYASQQEAVRRLRELDGLKTVFLSTASHELRTPATAIGGFASLLSGSWDRFDDAQRREFAERIAANARSLGAVVQDLLDFSLLDRGRLHLTIAEVDLGPLVRSVVDRLGPAVPEHEVACTVEAAPPVAADPNALERIITNLMTNAAKFSPPGSTITVGVRPSGDGAAIVVSDQGQGVPPEERDRIFTRFYRGSGEAVVKTRGVGIGLSVVAELTDRMGGSITIDDAPGGGARFRVDLPPATAMGQIKELDDASTA
jgi:signal transduction histidine kinase